jgi:arginyl-tRNA synthetase
MCSSVEVAGPGFLNITLEDAWLASLIGSGPGDVAEEAAAAAGVGGAETVVVDYSSPNAAKEMHVGHLRSTVIGDALVRVLEFLGHRVVRQNHLGDWGTQFGMLVEHLLERGFDPQVGIADLNALYQEAKQRFDAEPEFAERARERVVLLQGGDGPTLAVWHQLVEESERHYEEVYTQLGVKLERGDVRGESFYNPLLEETVAELEREGLTVVDDGALCVFPPGFVGRDGTPFPLMVRKRDGGFGYDATDLAAIRFRVRELGGDRLVYVVDARQSRHFSMLFAAAEMAGWLAPTGAPPGRPRAEHVAFGMVLGPDNRPFRTREGGTVRLKDLLDEAVQRAAAVVADKAPELSPEEAAAVARAVGMGALKYADLSNDRVKDYVFSWDRMLSFDGNTAPYLQYAHARICSIFRRAGVGVDSARAAVTITAPAERALVLALLGFEPAVRSVGETLEPHRLCTYLFDLASAFTTFYEQCSVLGAESESVRESRLALCGLTARTLSVGLGLLGIETPERM